MTDDPVAVILISSPAVAPVAVISTPPADAVRTTADAPFTDDAKLRDPVVSKSTPPVPESISIPPATLDAYNLRAATFATPAFIVIAPTSDVN